MERAVVRPKLRPRRDSFSWLGRRPRTRGTNNWNMVTAGGRERGIREGYEVVAECQADWEEEKPLTDALLALFPELFKEKSSAKNAARRKLVMVNDKVMRCSGKVSTSDLVTVTNRTTITKDLSIYLPKEVAETVKTIKVVYEDDHLGVMVKPRGMLSHGKGYECANSLVAHLLEPTKASVEESGGSMHRPRLCHRLDMLTGGLLLVAKTSVAMQALSKAFSERDISKEYFAIVHGKLEEESGIIDKPVEGKEAVTRFERGRTYTAGGAAVVTEVTLFPKTGRRNQIRKHLSGIGHPIVGDLKWCPPALLELIPQDKGMFLWARRLRFEHPVTGHEIRLCEEPPPVFFEL
ncbi:RNA pseudouridylate synthase [Chloropicon primus]|uniref:RNA pseudouridylate synthase n=1 Tax=Chloropicon primus TaxID=1764295 RepID=A0A5B8MG87_9CHLO|nr:RNA pseudouridylate synthase [Chloropicon primus]UPQ98676.1 RNA pseudouridylate synthase [Chloropicon primus]|eukprot:QDZ19466.1 RNA pseudouridylate synthase [Chloropicon primus]